MKEIEKLESIAKELRKDIVKMIYEAKSGHPGGSLSCIDILVTLYHSAMNLKTDEQGKRIDKFVLSKGHAAPAYYAVLASKGFISKDELMTLRKIESNLEGHPTNKINGIDVSSGSLGQGLSIANGMALSKKISNKEGYVYCLVGDGEIQEGQFWEALMTLNKYQLNRLILFIDVNGLQIDGTTEEVMPLGDLSQKIKSFGLSVEVIDGNKIEQILHAINTVKLRNTPTVILAKTIKGKGVSYMENLAKWHGKAPNEEELKIALQDLV